MLGLASRRRLGKRLTVAVAAALVPAVGDAAPAKVLRKRDDENEKDDDKKTTNESIDLGFKFTSADLGLVRSTSTGAPPTPTARKGDLPVVGEEVKPDGPAPSSSASSAPRSSSTSPPTPTSTSGSPEFGAVTSTSASTSASTKPESTGPSQTSASSIVALPDTTDAPLPTVSPQVGESKDHVKMEIGIAFGVIGAFLILAVGAFFWLKKRRANGGSSGSGGNIRGTEMMMRGSIEPRGGLPQYESRTQGEDWPTAPDPVVLDDGTIRRMSEALTEEDIERFASLQRKYTITRDADIPIRKPQQVRRASISSYVTMTVAGGLPNISNSGFDDSFLASIEKKGDPFADSFSPGSSLPPAPQPLRFPVKPTIQQPSRIRAMHKYNASDETLELTDPRISPGGRLHITNHSHQDSVITLAASPPKSKKKMAALKPLNVPLPPMPPQPWDMSHPSPAYSEVPARHRTVKSWVRNEADIRQRYDYDDLDSPAYAKSVATLYNRYSINSGMDTRRTEYEYY
ncbi:hypothetical protein H072_7021 [Dactylellina haptotyla CBS 200.50]|uniref:Uncharacterized protein n=1 Tax=Dactylellina haptotyla (strain CBS 200.50) TaxID=1284197 RepID=S8BV76_DACHA|nr:hypothetical protein H072_7021 [Dactylellina haptotyla CBS 200.50]